MLIACRQLQFGQAVPSPEPVAPRNAAPVADVAVAARKAHEAVAATGQEAEKPAEGKWPMKYIWPAAAFVTLKFGYGVTPWDTIRSIAAARGVDDDTQTLRWRAAIRFHSLLRCICLHQQLGCAPVHNGAGIGNRSGHAR